MRMSDDEDPTATRCALRPPGPRAREGHRAWTAAHGSPLGASAPAEWLAIQRRPQSAPRRRRKSNLRDIVNVIHPADTRGGVRRRGTGERREARRISPCSVCARASALLPRPLPFPHLPLPHVHVHMRPVFPYNSRHLDTSLYGARRACQSGRHQPQSEAMRSNAA